MSDVRPFRGLRPRPEVAHLVAAPPYDVLSAEEARRLAEGNPRSFLRVNRADLEFPPGTDAHDPRVYERAKENLEAFKADGTMIRDDTPCFYLYRLTMNGRPQLGLVSLTSVAEYDAGLIKKHEHTRPAKVADRADHILTLSAQVGPVFSTFRVASAVRRRFARLSSVTPDVDFVADDGVRHELWVVSDPTDVTGIVEDFRAMPHLYIADGHHRSEAASEIARRVRSGEVSVPGSDMFLNVLFPDDELSILPYNRVVRDTNGLSVTELVRRAGDRFDIEPSASAVAPDVEAGDTYVFGMYADGRWHRLTAKPGSFPVEHPTRSIPAAVLGENLLAPLLGISDPRTDERIDFVGGIRGTSELERLVDTERAAIAFSLPATTIRQLLAVADAGEVMPPKSTWFEPKLRTGMVVNELKGSCA